uniref:Uncharacterized protein n=1 Tax=Myotis lucifugus TaxID=59463 RepID=G1P6W0_MYOLU
LQLCSQCVVLHQDSFLSTLKMSIRTPPTLLELAAKRLLRDQASAIAALEYLPAELFPYLFVMAYRGGHRPQLLKAMHPPDHAPTRAMGLKAMLDALDVLLSQEVQTEVRPRRCKLRVLDLSNTGANFWDIQHPELLTDGTSDCAQLQPQHGAPLAPLEVFLDLNFNERDRDKFFMHIIQWAQQREGLLHLCCKALRISEVPFQRVRRVLDRVQLDCIQEVEVHCTWDLPTLGTFALYLGQMSNLQRLSLPDIDVLAEEDEEQEEEGDFSQFLSQMLRLWHLRELHMHSPSFFRGRLDQMLRCLQTPLDELSLTYCQRLTHSDLTHLFQCPNLRQLKILHLLGLSLADFSPEPLRVLLEAVAPTLQDLGLDNCGMADSQVEAILPVLSRCHQLRKFTISINNFPVATVEKLLRHTTGLRSLEVEVYPVPLECDGTQGTVNQERLALIRAELTGTLR